MKINRANTMSISIDHLSGATRCWMIRQAHGMPAIDVIGRGLFVSVNELDGDLPPDLGLCAAFAKENDISDIVFDAGSLPQEGLPLYSTFTQDAQGRKHWSLAKDHLHLQHLEARGIHPQMLSFSPTDDADAYDVESFDRANLEKGDLCIEPNGQKLEDGDYEIIDGAWFSFGNVCLRITEPLTEPGHLHVKAFPQNFVFAQNPVYEMKISRASMVDAAQAELEMEIA